ncbi:putative glucan 1,3-beta-glucosidase A [Panicum miliaceum]|uniref:Glucan 1,3-beta-glucosidase A n=1 Tax=Panicum miliaceum TaxID=4540 RepID=A0A3L6TE68_PANMI|nr:putative glucan 1,3-beta-glucosidase A [Panicum miliaceum]
MRVLLPLLLLVICSSWLLPQSAGANRTLQAEAGAVRRPRVRADGTQLQFKSVAWNRYLAAEKGGGAPIVADREKPSGWETFKLWRINETTFNFRVFGNQFSRRDGHHAGGPSETFQLVRRDGDKNRVRIRAPNGLFLQAKTMKSVTADHSEDTNWGDDDPSVFVTNRVAHLRGEYQLCNGYGIRKARQVLRNHWRTFITESDFSFIASSGLNAVRIPVGWWIASYPHPPRPFVGGSLQTLDNAFTWAERYNLGVIVDLHAAPGAQNPYEHSATRDGSQEWGTTDENIAQTVQVIDFLASRYARSPSLLAVSLLNSPLPPRATPPSLTRGGSADATELLEFAGRFSRAVLDVHYYNLFTSRFAHLTADENIDFARKNRSSELAAVTRRNGRPLTFVGEWVAEWNVRGASKRDYQRFAQVQQEVYGRATFGWAYWMLKNVNHHWSMQWMIQNGYITLDSSRSRAIVSPLDNGEQMDSAGRPMLQDAVQVIQVS